MNVPSEHKGYMVGFVEGTKFVVQAESQTWEFGMQRMPSTQPIIIFFIFPQDLELCLVLPRIAVHKICIKYMN